MLSKTANALLGVALLATPYVSAACDREFLESVAASYVRAQAMGQIQQIEPLDYVLSYTENFNKTDVLFGKISQPEVIAHNRSTYDTVACATYTELIVTTASHPYVIGTQIRLSNSSTINQIDSIITDAGDWLFNATGYLYWSNRESWAAIPEESRDTRETIKAAADAYLDVFNNKTVVVPWGTPCARLEGGAYTGTGLANDSCNLGVPSGIVLNNRRYVVDEVFGTVDVFLTFGGDGGAPDTHEFRIEKGKLRYVHTMSVTNNGSLPGASRLPNVPRAPRMARL